MAKSIAAEKSSKSSKSNNTFSKTFELVVMTLYHLRKIVMAIPVIFYALRIAVYNGKHLPVEVGLFLQNNGNFLRMIDRGTAVFIPLVVTFACLGLMMFSRKAMYAWAISIFSLALPILLLVSNVYPA